MVFSSAQAASVVDQANIPASGALSGFSSGQGLDQDARLVQTFTVGVTGLMTQLDLAIIATPFTPSEGGFTVSLRSPLDVQLYSAHVPYSVAPNVFSTDWTAMPQFLLGASSFAVAAGDMYSIVVTADPNQPIGTVTWLRSAENVPFAYAGGQAFASYFGNPTIPLSGDFGFRTYVDTAVPEPDGWALMILGFGVVGGASRRRRHAPA